jgi:hypothetical protein
MTWPNGSLTVSNHSKTISVCAFPIVFFLAWIMLPAPAAVSHSTSSDPGREEILEARRELQISEATETRIVNDLQRLKDSGEASPDIIREYEAYLDRVQQMVAIQRQIVADMESTYLKYFSSRATEEQVRDSGEKEAESKQPDEDPHDKLAHLDREFDESLATFDDLLLREMEAIRLRRANEMHDLAQEAAAAAQRLRDRGLEVDTSSPGEEETAQTEGEEQTGSRSEESTDIAGGSGEGQGSTSEADGGPENGAITPNGETVESGPETAKGGGGGSKGEGGGQTQWQTEEQAVYDDIVARQLREAAERETDPELKKRLWQEYEDYKRGTKE